MAYHGERRTIQKAILLSPLSAHFLETIAQRLGISQAEFVRRLIDAALLEYCQANLYRLPTEFITLTDLPMPVPKPFTPSTQANGKTASPEKGSLIR